jgi:hypothetical protein
MGQAEEKLMAESNQVIEKDGDTALDQGPADLSHPPQPSGE